jgi:mono/diheme cytochrome c family protein
MLSVTACDDEDEKPPVVELSERAKKGLEIVPFELDEESLTDAQREQVGLGSYLVNAAGECFGCHSTPQPNGPPLYMGGGTPFPIGPSGEVVYARNLTPDADTGMKLTEAEFIESMRTGKDYASEDEAEQLIVMPWTALRWASTDDLKAMYAYLKRVPAVRNPVPNDIKGAAGAARPVPFPGSFTDGAVARTLPAENSQDALNSQRGLAIQPLADPPGLASLSEAERASYGRGSYLANALSNCNACHTNPERDFSPGPNYAKVNAAQFLTGGQVFTVPPGLNVLSRYTRSMTTNLLGETHGRLPDTYEQFRQIITSGEVTQGSTTRKLAFPMAGAAAAYAQLVDDDLKAIYTYLKAQTPLTGAADKRTQPPARYCSTSAECASGESCNAATNECVGGACTQDSDCGACQTCTANVCAAPQPSSACLRSGI